MICSTVVLLGRGETAGLYAQGTHTMVFTGPFLGQFAAVGNAVFDYFQTEFPGK
jgi:hypothetical protein